MAKNSLKSMVFKTEEEDQSERLTSKVTVDKGIQMFLEAKATDWKPSTLKFKTQRLAVLSAAAPGNGVVFVEDLVPKFARRYRAHRQTQVTNPTVHHDEVAMKALTKWCVINEYVDRDPLANYKALPMKKADPKTRRPAEQWELDKVITVIEKRLSLEAWLPLPWRGNPLRRSSY